MVRMKRKTADSIQKKKNSWARLEKTYGDKNEISSDLSMIWFKIQKVSDTSEEDDDEVVIDMK